MKLFAKNEISVRRMLFIISFSLSFVSLFILSLLWIISEIEQTRKMEERAKKIILDTQREEVEKYAEITVDYINNLKNLSDEISEEQLKKNILNFVETIRFGYNGYIFVNTFDGKSLVYDGKVVTGEYSIKDKLDPDGNNIFKMEYNAAKKPEGGFIEYSFKKIQGNLPEPKVAYVKAVPEWGWIVGAGDYVVDANKTMENVSNVMREKLIKRLLLILSVFIIITLISYFVSKYFSKFAVSQLNILLSHFKNPTDDKDHFKTLKMKEMKKVAEEVVKIENEKKRAEKELKDTLANMERIVEERTAELKKQNEELKRYNNLFVNREFRIKELRDEIERLKMQLNNKNT